jgi:hypothetical protein
LLANATIPPYGEQCLFSMQLRFIIHKSLQDTHQTACETQCFELHDTPQSTFPEMRIPETPINVAARLILFPLLVSMNFPASAFAIPPDCAWKQQQSEKGDSLKPKLPLAVGKLEYLWVCLRILSAPVVLWGC